MAANLNKVILIGNLVRDPELRKTPSGASVADLRLAVNRRFKAADGQFKDETCFVTVSVWGRSGEACKQYLSKGSPVMVEGHLRLDEWEKNGQKQSRLTVVGENVQFLSSSRGRTEDVSGPPANEQAAAEASAAPVVREEAAPEAGAPQNGDSDNLPF